MLQALTDSQIKARCPSVFATGGSDNVSDRYRFIPTIDVINGMRENGYEVVMARQTRCHNEVTAPFTKHLIRMRVAS